MKFTQEIEIEKPIDAVVALFDNPENFDKWMPDLLNYQPLSGTPGSSGAKNKMTFKMGKGEMIMIETIINHNLPDELSATYEAKGIFNTIKYGFTEISSHKTRYFAENEFKMKGYLKIMELLIPWVIKKQSMEYMKYFKQFAESKNQTLKT